MNEIIQAIGKVELKELFNFNEDVSVLSDTERWDKLNVLNDECQSLLMSHLVGFYQTHNGLTMDIFKIICGMIYLKGIDVDNYIKINK